MQYKKVEQDSDFSRDMRNGAIINTNDQAYSNYIKSKKIREEKRREISDLKDEISEIKSLLRTLLDNNK
ncbi:virion structural protein [Synechococcus phage S-T4]|jgi:predicted transcriptional regulator|uniref:Uncharacterized protein n=1 Tax=Synechococcus phage S-T4 TaxID=2268578 RepID=A0A385EFK1_9CAUD|nr:virion structural protein [Synechococcus phage S-T4]AXQ70593.1 hypothetical protein [Synechococcus phage S-T4]